MLAIHANAGKTIHMHASTANTYILMLQYMHASTANTYILMLQYMHAYTANTF